MASPDRVGCCRLAYRVTGFHQRLGLPSVSSIVVHGGVAQGIRTEWWRPFEGHGAFGVDAASHIVGRGGLVPSFLPNVRQSGIGHPAFNRREYPADLFLPGDGLIFLPECFFLTSPDQRIISAGPERSAGRSAHPGCGSHATSRLDTYRVRDYGDQRWSRRRHCQSLNPDFMGLTGIGFRGVGRWQRRSTCPAQARPGGGLSPFVIGRRFLPSSWRRAILRRRRLRKPHEHRVQSVLSDLAFIGDNRGIWAVLLVLSRQGGGTSRYDKTAARHPRRHTAGASARAVCLDRGPGSAPDSLGLLPGGGGPEPNRHHKSEPHVFRQHAERPSIRCRCRPGRVRGDPVAS